jgi:hypothetical protein
MRGAQELYQLVNYTERMDGYDYSLGADFV